MAIPHIKRKGIMIKDEKNKKWSATHQEHAKGNLSATQSRLKNTEH